MQGCWAQREPRPWHKAVVLVTQSLQEEELAPDPRSDLCHGPHCPLPPASPTKSSPRLLWPVLPHCQLPVIAPEKGGNSCCFRIKSSACHLFLQPQLQRLLKSWPQHREAPAGPCG